MKSIGSLVSQVLEDFEPDIRMKRNGALLLWSSIAGDDLSTYLRPVGVRGSVLVLMCYHPAAAMEVRIRKKEILEKFNSLWDREIFTDLRTVTRSNGR
ncbi:MAG: hypothetical protein AVO35_01555 [Candidatus Aegiribacteria sp. MLS_C]|nr:MAG: hypothetical protein AVO35_01555 [Candidatus Aegiribacteria sp. MLS_C]